MVDRTSTGVEGAHPRACGENIAPVLSDFAALGSSPRVRGKPWVQVFPVQVRGLIPARAGKTLTTAQLHVLAKAHPRACGENAEGAVDRLTMTGSSPRVRGKRPRVTPPPHTDDLIPARAGKTGA